LEDLGESNTKMDFKETEMSGCGLDSSV